MPPDPPDARSPDDPALTLLHRWQQDADEDALDALLQLEIRELAATLRWRTTGQLRPSVSASDLAQEAVLRMLRKEEAPTFESPKELRRYLWTSAWRLFLNHVGSPKQRLRPLEEIATQEILRAIDGEESGPDVAEVSERDLALEFTINLLKPEEQDVLRRTYFQHQDANQIADAMGLSRAAVAMRLTRARRNLARKLSAWAEIIQ